MLEMNGGIVLLVRWALLAMGIVYFLTEAAIWALPRMLFARMNVWTRTLAYCRACTGFWVGVGLGFARVWPFDMGFYQAALESGCAAMAIGAVWAAILPNHAWKNEQGEGEGEEAGNDEAKESQDEQAGE